MLNQIYPTIVIIMVTLWIKLSCLYVIGSWKKYWSDVNDLVLSLLSRWGRLQSIIFCCARDPNPPNFWKLLSELKTSLPNTPDFDWKPKFLRIQGFTLGLVHYLNWLGTWAFLCQLWICKFYNFSYSFYHTSSVKTVLKGSSLVNQPYSFQ